jgi:hypothetical protein
VPTVIVRGGEERGLEWGRAGQSWAESTIWRHAGEPEARGGGAAPGAARLIFDAEFELSIYSFVNNHAAVYIDPSEIGVLRGRNFKKRDARREELLDCIRKVNRGETSIPQALLEKLAAGMSS